MEDITNQKYKTTVICLSYNRPLFLKRVIEYHKQFYSGYKLIILDGSENKINVEDTNEIKYLHYPTNSYFIRWSKLIDLINTDYCMFVSDDELHVRSSVDKYVEFLEKNSEYSSCGGLPILFTIFFKKYFRGMRIYEKLKSNDNDNPLDRMKFWMEDRLPNSLYSVLRTEVLKKIIVNISSLNRKLFPNLGTLIEDRVELAFAFAGKNKIINEISWFRSQENNIIGWFEDNEALEEWWNIEVNKKKYFIEEAADFFCNINPQIDKDEFKNIFTNLYDKQTDFHFKAKYKRFKKRKLMSNFKFIPKFIKKSIRLTFNLNGTTISKYLKKYSTQNYVGDILLTEKFILEFYKKIDKSSL